ncbi:hypothetical protein GCM10010425_51080 [Streptomyces spororaveus]|uniref:Uncharacterized protein n=1 Tax=Streptomyces spororaveus TaxID=284039 RepID=A0ABQ3TKM9_9ACTN|nr:hypothetical protein Sspor_65300 [Streptomyces spororaveus]
MPLTSAVGSVLSSDTGRKGGFQPPERPEFDLPGGRRAGGSPRTESGARVPVGAKGPQGADTAAALRSRLSRHAACGSSASSLIPLSPSTRVRTGIPAYAVRTCEI